MNTKRLLQLFTKTALAFLVVFAFVASSVLAQKTVYVSASAGDDSFDGSSPNVESGLVGPKRTIAGAFAIAVNGDTVIIEAGTYAENVTVAANLSIEMTASGVNTTVTVGTADGAADLTFNSATVSVTNSGATLRVAGGGAGDDVVFDSGTVTLSANALTIPSQAAGEQLIMDEGVIAGNSPINQGILNLSYIDATGGARVAGLEAPATLNGGVLLVSQTGGSVTFPNPIATGAITNDDTNNATFAGAVTAGGLIMSTGGGNLAFSGGVTANAGITMASTGSFSASSVVLDDGDVITTAVGNSFTVSGPTTVQVDSGLPAATPIVNVGTMSLSNLTFTFVDTDPGAAGDDVTPYTIDNDGSFTVNGTFSEAPTTANTNAGAAAGDMVSAPVFLTNNTAGASATFAGFTTLSGDVQNSIAAPGGVYFNGGGLVAGDIDNTGGGTIHIGPATTLELTSDVNHTNLIDFNGPTGTLLISGDGAQPAAGINVQGNLSITGDGDFGAAMTVGGNLSWSGNGNLFAGGATVGGDLTMTGTGGGFAGDFDVNGDAILGSTAPADDGPDFAGNVQVDGTATINNDVNIAGGVGSTNSITAGNLMVNDALFLATIGPGTVHNVSGTLGVNAGGSITFGAGAAAVGDITMNVDVTNISPDAVGITLSGNVVYNAQDDFTAGTFDGTAVGSVLQIDPPSGGATIAAGPNTRVYNLVVTGNERTATFTQSIEVQNDFRVEDDATADLTDEQIRMTAAADTDGAVVIATDATLVASMNTGAIAFAGTGGSDTFTIDSDTPGQAIGTLTNIVIVMTGAATAADVTLTDDATITGVVSLVNGGLTIQAGDVLTFDNTNDTAGISRNLAGANTTITGTTAGQHDLTYVGAIGGATAVGNEYTQTTIDDFYANVTGGGLGNPGSIALSAGGAVSVAGDFRVSPTSTVTLSDNVNVGGNLLVEATDASDGQIASAVAQSVTLSGADQVHNVSGRVDSPLVFAANSTVGGTSDNDRESNVTNVTVNASTTVDFAGPQEILGNVVVNGTLMLGLSDADGVGADDQDVEGTVLVDEAGTLMLTQDVTVQGASTIGNDGASGGVASLNMNALRYTANGTFTADADSDLGEDGTLEVNANFGTNTSTVPNLNVDTAGIMMTSGVDVSGILDIDEDFSLMTFDLTLSGDGQFVDTSGDGQVDIGGTTGFFETTGTTLTMAEDVSVPNFRLNSTDSTTTLASTTAAQRTLFVDNNGVGAGEAEFIMGTLDLNGHLFVVRDTDGADESMIDYNGGTVVGTGASNFIANDDNDGLGGIDLDTGGSTFEVPNFAVTIGGGGGAAADANDGLDIVGGDALHVTSVFGLTGGTVFTNKATDAMVSFADNSRIVRNLGVLEQVPTFGVDMTIEYDAAVTTDNELAGTFHELQVDAVTVTLADGVSITINVYDANGTLAVDGDDDDNQTVTITDGGTAEVSVSAPTAANTDVGEVVYAGVFFIVYDGTATTDLVIWNGTPDMVTVNDGSAGTASTVTLGSAKTTQDLVVAASETLAMGASNLTVLGDFTQSGAVTSATGALIFAGSEPQAYSTPAGAGATLPIVTFNNPMGVSVTGGNLNVTTVANFVNGVVTTTSSNAVVLNHIGPGTAAVAPFPAISQGFTQTGGGVFGNVRKFISGAAAGFGAAADRMTMPTATADGTPRFASITFNQPNEIGAPVAGASGIAGFAASTGISLTVNHVEMAPGGSNNLPLTTVDNLGGELKIARYPAFYWLITSSVTLSPSVDYDIELSAQGFAAFDGEDIERTRTIRRQGGAQTNFWFLVGGGIPANNDNFAESPTWPITIVRDAIGALNAGSGVLFTMALESNMVVTDPDPITVNAGDTQTLDLLTVFSGGTGEYSYDVTSADENVATASVDDMADELTVTGEDVGATTLTVTVMDELNDSRTVTVAVNVNEPFVAGEIEDQSVPFDGELTIDLATVFTGGTPPVGYVVSSSDSTVVVGSESGGTLTVTPDTTGTATITVEATDDTGQTATVMFDVTVNTDLVAGMIDAVELTEGESTTVDLSTVFSGGGTMYSFTAASADDNFVSVTIEDGILTATAVEAYDGGTTVGDFDVTVTAMDEAGDTATATLTVDVFPIPGDLTGDGPDPASASLALDHFLDLADPPLTDKQIAAADFNDDGDVTPFDAAGIFGAFLGGKDELVPFVASNVTFGEITRENGLVSIPVVLSGDISDVVSAGMIAQIDPAYAKVKAVDGTLGQGWIFKHTVSESGTLKIGLAGNGDIPSDGQIATITVELAEGAPSFDLTAEGAVNNNPISSIDAVEVVELPETFALQGNYPNPFNPTTTVQFDLPETADVSIQVIDVLGRVVMTLPEQTVQAGAKRSIQVNASQLASGSYFYRVVAKMESKTLVESGRMTLVK